MRFLVHHHIDGRSSKQTIRFYVPSPIAQHAVPRGRQAGEIRNLATGNKSKAMPEERPASSRSHDPVVCSITETKGDMA